MNTHDIKLPSLPYVAFCRVSDIDPHESHHRQLGVSADTRLYTEDQVRAAIEADRKRREAPAAEGWPEPLSEFSEGQWWVKELDTLKDLPGASNDQKRAVAVVHHLLASVDRQRRGEPAACFKCGHVKHGGECVNVAPQPAEPVSKTDWSNELSSWSDEDFICIFHERPDLANRLRKMLAEPAKLPSDSEMAEIWKEKENNQ